MNIEKKKQARWTIKEIREDSVAAIKAQAAAAGLKIGEFLDMRFAPADQAGCALPIKLFMTPALPAHYVAEREDGTRWIILSTAFGREAWASAREYKGNHILERLPDYMAKLYILDD